MDDWFLTDWSLMDFGEKKVPSDKKPELTVVPQAEKPAPKRKKASDGHRSNS